jgi:sRNA-binding protein
MYLHREDRDDAIRYLAERYPRCFAENPRVRRPLKKNIMDDLEKEGVLDVNRLTQVLDYYTANFTYCSAVVAGTERVGLSGEKSGVVTEQDQREAERRVLARKKELAEKKALRDSAAAAVAETPPNKSINGHEVMTSKNPPPPNPPPTTLHPALAPVQQALVAVNVLLTDAQFEPMRRALAPTALKQVTAVIENVVDALERKEIPV